METTTVRLSPNFSFKRCEPAPAHGLLPDEPAFGNAYQQKPVSARFGAHGEMTGTGFAFEDYNRAQTRRRKTCGERRLPTPSWAVNRSEMQQLIVRFWERRADVYIAGKGSLEERLRYAEWQLQHVWRPIWFERLKRLCHRRLASDDPNERRMLERQIKNVDTLLRTADQGPALIAGLIYFYYGAKEDSVGTGAALGINPVSVRQILNRLHHTWREMQDGTDSARRGRKPLPR